MTKYILAGGNDRDHIDYGHNLAAEIYRTVTRPVRILSCFFSSQELEWQIKSGDFEAWFREYLGKDITYEVARFEDFVEQVKVSDVVYLHGGDNVLLLDVLQSISGLPDGFAGKVIVGSSAGANYLSKKYWTRGKSAVETGAGVLNVGVMAHYGSRDDGTSDGKPIDWELAEQSLREELGSMAPILEIREGEFVVIEV